MFLWHMPLTPRPNSAREFSFHVELARFEVSVQAPRG